MAVSGWYDDNEHRAYPFPQDRARAMTRSDAAPVTLPDGAVVDFGCVVGLDADYADGVDVVYLASVARAGSAYTFRFRSTAPGLADWSLAFARTASDPEYAVEEAEAVSDHGETAGGCGDAFLWDGFLVTGTLAGLAAVLADGQSMTADRSLAVAPTLVQDLGKAYVRSVNLANAPRTVALPPDGCPAASSSADSADSAEVAVNQICMAGPLVLRQGYNVAIRQSDADNTLTISARAGAGAGQPCGEVPAYPGERPPAGSTLLTGGPACDEVLRSINGVSSAVLRLVAGRGVSIAPDPANPHALIVDVDLHDLAVCPTLEESSQGL